MYVLINFLSQCVIMFEEKKWISQRWHLFLSFRVHPAGTTPACRCQSAKASLSSPSLQRIQRMALLSDDTPAVISASNWQNVKRKRNEARIERRGISPVIRSQNTAFWTHLMTAVSFHVWLNDGNMMQSSHSQAGDHQLSPLTCASVHSFSFSRKRRLWTSSCHL